MTRTDAGVPDNDPLSPRSDKGGRPTRAVAARLGDHILSVALAEYSRHGIDGISLDHIARAARVSKRTLYARFKDRDSLLLAAIERGIARIVAQLPDVRFVGSLSDQLLHLGTEMVRISLHADVMGLERLLSSVAQRSPDIYDRVSDVVQSARLRLIRSALEQAVSRGEIDGGRIDLAASIIFDILVTNARRHAMMHHIDCEDVAAIRDYIGRAIDMILHGIVETARIPAATTHG